MPSPERSVLVSPAGEIGTKAPSTKRWFSDVLQGNLTAVLDSRGVAATVHRQAGRLLLTGDAEAAARAAAEVFGVRRAQLVRPLGSTRPDELVAAAADLARPWVAGRSFAARIDRHGGHAWRSIDLERQLGTALEPHAAGVDLEDPEVTVRVLVDADEAYLVEAVHEGPGGLPTGTQGEALLLVSGGFDSAVAAWYLLRRGVTVHFLHAEMACAQTDTALAVVRELCRRWAPATDPSVWVVDFAEVRRCLLADVDPRLRQVRLKELMLRAADEVADRAAIPALATGESIGQVSTQTLPHLAMIDRAAGRLVLRPLEGFDKDEIVAAARRIGTHDLALRSREVCDLSDGPVATRATDEQLEPARLAAADGLATRAAADAWELKLRTWSPGMPAPWAG